MSKSKQILEKVTNINEDRKLLLVKVASSFLLLRGLRSSPLSDFISLFPLLSYTPLCSGIHRGSVQQYTTNSSLLELMFKTFECIDGPYEDIILHMNIYSWSDFTSYILNSVSFVLPFSKLVYSCSPIHSHDTEIDIRDFGTRTTL